jgi:hypothetical protein
MSSFLRGEKDSQILPSKKIKDKRHNNAYKDAGGQREIECESLPLNGDITRQIPQPGDLASRRKDQPKNDQDDSNIDQRLTKSGHFCNSLLAFLSARGDQNLFQKRLGWFLELLPFGDTALRPKCSYASSVATRPRGVRFKNPA